MGLGCSRRIAGPVLWIALLALIVSSRPAAGGTKDPLAAADTFARGWRAVAGLSPVPADVASRGTAAAPADTASRRGAAAEAADQKTSPKPARKAVPKKPPANRLPFGITGSFDLQTIYDDNIFRYSPENILEFRQGLNPDKFNLDTYDDLILSPRLELSLDRRLLGPMAANFRVRYTRWQYTSNPHKTNESWMFRFRQPVSARAFVELGYTYAPRAYIRELSDRAPFEPRSTTPLRWTGFNALRHALLAAAQVRVSQRLTTRLEGGRVIRYYNRPFMENDNWEWNGALSGQFTLTKVFRLSGRYAYSNTKARALDTVGETTLTSDDGDPSYERDLYELSLRYRPVKAIWLFREGEIMGQYQEYYYTSDIAYHLDATHTGRKDEVWAGEATATSAPVWRQVTLELGYRHTERSSSSTASDVGTESIEEDKNYRDNRVWLGMTYPF